MSTLSRVMAASLMLSFVADSGVAGAADPHPLNVNDLVAFDRVSEPAVSPDGKRVVFTVSRLDWEANKRRTDLWIADTHATGPQGSARPLTSHDAADVSPVFSPDGRHVYFLSSRSGSMQVWRLPLESGEGQQITKLPLDVGAFRLSPDGSKLAVAVEVFPSCRDLDCTKKMLDANGKKKTTGQLYDGLFTRHWDSWADGRRSHLVVLSSDGEGNAMDVMPGMDADAPSKPFGGADEYTFTPDGKSLIFSARDAGREEAWSTNFDLFVVPVDGSAPPKSITSKNKAWDTAPVFSPDGKTLAYLAMTRPGYESDRRHIWLRDVSTGGKGGWNGAERELAADWDHSPEELVFSKDGKTLYTTADHVGNSPLFAIDVASGKSRILVTSGHCASPRVIAGAGGGAEIVFSLDHLRAPAELFRVNADGTGQASITNINGGRLANVRLGEPEQFSFAGANGDTVYAWMVKPVGFVAGKKYPIAYLIHGGPQGSFNNHFHYRWNPEIYAAAGYVAIMVDFHGSTGYGQAFTDAIGGDWGGKPFVDLQKGLEAATRKYAFLDGDRACALGASFGGYMINWIAGSWPDRFKCLVAHDGNLDERMAYFDTEELWFPEWEHRGTPWDNPAGYTQHNPIDLVKNWKTPMLVVHGGKDYRVVDTQGMSTFTALQRRGIPSRFLYFPDENHWVLKPHNSVQWHETVLDWLGRYTKPGSAK